MSEHDWFRDHLDLYVAGALAPEESLRAERHAADCAACAQELAQRRLLDSELDRLCSPVHFTADWDDRIQARWRLKHRPPRRLPVAVRWAFAAAAVLMIAAVGAGVNAMVQEGMVAFPGSEALQAKGFQLGVDLVGGTIMLLDTSSSMGEPEASDSGRAHAQNNLKRIDTWDFDLDGSLTGASRASTGQQPPVDATYGIWRDAGMITGLSPDRYRSAVRRPADIKQSNSIEFFPPALGLVMPDGVRGHTSASGGIIGGKPPGSEMTMPRRGDDVSVRGTVGLGTGSVASYGVSVPGSVNPAETFGVRDGETSKRVESLKDLAGTKDDLRLGMQLREGSVRNGRMDDMASPWFHTKEDKKAEDSKGSAKEYGKETASPARDVNGTTLNAPPASFGWGRTGAAKAGGGGQTADHADPASLAKLNQLRAGAEYFKLLTTAGGDVQAGAPRQIQDLQEKNLRVKREEPRAGKSDRAKDEPAAVAAGQPKPEPQVAQRKIIRSGDMEFEVSVFDDTVAQIAKLIGAIPGAFVATVNSEKLPNGKVKGSVVVRVPPEALDRFVLDLRQGLAKTGELRSQKIGSADVTKQYTDTESRLRAARAMEERIIAIIKTGKGEVKDLIAAERELGVWRTKIEEMEGEIRYYNNQVALSTLTITVYEKEIRAAATMVITEHVTMRIEADDVEKSLQTALVAVTEAKGRVTKSDLKQHAAGQLEAVLTFEVAPAQAGAVKDKLKTLGIVTHQDAQRLQQAEGGAAPAGEIKSRTNDVRFNVTLYNVANIQPREAHVLQVVVSDVPAEHRKLQGGVAAAGGQVRVSQLDEKDRTNTFAQLDFDVPATQRELFDKVLAGLGEVVSRSTTRAGPGESATDRKVGYRVTLKSEASVPPRETFTLSVYSLDVPALYRKLQETAAQLKGNIRALQLNEQDKNNVTAQFDVDLLRSDLAVMEKLLGEAGEVASRTTSRLQPGEIASDRKVGYRLALHSQVPPRETLDLNIEVADVQRSAEALAALVKSAQGRVTAWEGTQDASGKAVAIQLFDVPLTAKDALAAQLEAIGKVRGQKVTQNLKAPDGKLATAHINVRLTNVTPIVPSDEGIWPQVRRSLSYAFTLLSVSLMFLIVGVSVLLPWALLVWVGVKVVRRMRSKGQAAA